MPEPLEMHPIASSNIASAGYDEEQGELIVEFKNGRRYAYSGADRVLLDDMLTATSAGAYFARNVRNLYPHRQV